MSKDVNSSEKRLAIGEGVKIYTKKTDGGGGGSTTENKANNHIQQFINDEKQIFPTCLIYNEIMETV